MFKIIYSILLFFIMAGVTFAHHSNEKYCFECMYKYKIGDKKNETYEFEFDLQNTISVNNRNSIGRIQTKDLSKLVEEQLKDKKTGLCFAAKLFDKTLMNQKHKIKVNLSFIV